MTTQMEKFAVFIIFSSILAIILISFRIPSEVWVATIIEVGTKPIQENRFERQNANYKNTLVIRFYRFYFR